MKKLSLILSFNVALLMLVGCAGNSNEKSIADSSGNSSVIETTEDGKLEESDTENANDKTSGESDSDSASESNNAPDKEDKNTLPQYSSEQIEYARVWLQLGPNQELDELNVRHISAGEPLNPDDATSGSYPEDVIQLAGARLVDGSITYSGNGDGTINVYNVPLRWDGNYPAGESFYADIIENTKLVSIDTGNDEEIIKLIEVQK
ncbi:hypothetical protein [Fredinandcohnia quinoae]|uniref:Lipoprotein n=1 Tax=Fredinandcohnia quinoae TaxID=2918902 RepID=A0AAW5E4E4_9BACI|nr:hypothetical protein [Fredinandcohnia sp. SECRCQ15]MCH1624206.1 hypothetical protein [Fredinandcohnia sp. SECRCQ15]